MMNAGAREGMVMRSEFGQDDRENKRKKSEVFDDLPPGLPLPPPHDSPGSVRSSKRRNGEAYDDSSRSRRDGRCYAGNDDLMYVFVEILFDDLTSGRSLNLPPGAMSSHSSLQ